MSPMETLKQELIRLKRWIDDLQSGMYINCVYCGHRYGPADKVPSSMADALKLHIAQCPRHPMHEVLETLKSGRDLLFYFANVSDGGPYREKAQAWLDQAQLVIERAQMVKAQKKVEKKRKRA
jgi:hypothetical protein